MATPRVITRTEAEAWKKLQSNAKVKALDLSTLGEPNQDDMLTALAKYIPATVIIGYMLLDAVFKSLEPPPLGVWIAFFVILLFGAFVLTYRITAADPGRGLSEITRNEEDVHPLIENLELIINHQRLKQAIVAVIAFAGYVLAIGGPFAYINKCGGTDFCISFLPNFEWQGYYGAVSLVLAILVVGIIIGKDILAD
jgi:hypothetical protein